MGSDKIKKQTYRLRGIELDTEAAEAKIKYDSALIDLSKSEKDTTSLYRTKVDIAYRNWQAAERAVILFRNHITTNMINIDNQIPSL